MEILGKERCASFVLKITVLLLANQEATSVVNKIRTHSRLRYEQPRPMYVNYAILDRLIPVYSNTDRESSVPSQSASRWSSYPTDTRNLASYPAVPPSGDVTESNGNVVFPDFDIEPRKAEFEKVPECPDSTFCENVRDYPTEFVNNMMKNNQNIPNYANIDVVDPVAERIDSSGSESLCVSTERVVYPKTAETANKEWLFIVNHPNFTQGVRVETCEEQSKGCRLIDGFAEGYSTSCEQKYIYRQLTAIVKGSVDREYFRFPASCCCHVRFEGGNTRFGSMDSAISKIFKTT